MAVWKKEKKSKKKSKKKPAIPEGIIGPVVFIIAVVIVGILLFTAQPETAATTPTLTITTSEQPGAVGFHEVYVSSDQPLASVGVLINGKPAVQKSMAGNMYTFEFFVSPYEPIGIRPIVVDAVDSAGRTIHDEGKGFYVGYNAFGDKMLDVVYYTYEETGYGPLEMAQLIIFEDNKTLNLFYELVEEGEYNTPSINAMIPLIQNLSYLTSIQQKHFNQYAIVVQGREWVTCQDNTTAIVPLEECRRILDEENAILLRYPYYPSAQIYVTNNTIEMQPAPATQAYVMESIIAAMDDVYFKAFLSLEDAESPAANETSLPEQ